MIHRNRRTVAIALAALVAALFAAAACGSKQDSTTPPESLATVAPKAGEVKPAEPEGAPPAAEVQDPAAAVTGKAELGKPAPDFTLTAVDGKSHKLSELRGKTVVLEWFNPDCPFVKYAHQNGPLVDLAKSVAGEKLVWLSINSGGEGKQGHGLERNKEAQTQYAMANPILLDPSGAVGKAYQAEKTPHMFIIDSQGTLVYRGGVDNAPMGAVDPQRPRYPDSAEGDLINYIKGALQDMEQTRALRLADTPAYGCSVKYAS